MIKELTVTYSLKINLKQSIMSYAGYVLCNCYKNGKTTEPPYKEFVVMDDTDGLYLDLPDPDEDADNKALDAYFEKENEFENWVHSACEHEDMEYASESIANSMGMYGFRTFIAENGGEDRFPILTAQLPKTNGGGMPARLAADGLKELKVLKNLNTPIDKVVLREKESGGMIMIGNYDEDIPFAYFDRNKRFLLNKDGFYILEEREDLEEGQLAIVFFSKRFEMIRRAEKEFGFLDQNDDSPNHVYLASMGLFDSEIGVSHSFEVLKETKNGSDYWESVIESLENLFQASVETGNPVLWC